MIPLPGDEGAEVVVGFDLAYPASVVETILTAGTWTRRRRWRWLPWPRKRVFVPAPRVGLGEVVYHHGAEVLQVRSLPFTLEPGKSAMLVVRPEPPNDRGPH